jgi:glycosyltransferase involved in cell wall biosynthesis
MSEVVPRPKVSVCVATYNQRAYIKDCLLSVLMQGCDAELEILVGDDCSTDGTGEIVREVAAAYPGRLIAPRRERNLGGSRNYLDLIARATGDFIAHLDGDDYWMPGKLAAQVEFFRAHPECAAVYTNAVVINEGGELVGAFNNRQPPVFDTDYLLRGGNFLNHSSMLYRADLKQHLLAIDGEYIDYRMHLRLSRHGLLGYVNQILVAYRSGVATSMLQKSSDRVLELYWEAIRDPHLEGLARNAQKRVAAKFFTVTVYGQLAKGRVSSGLNWARRIWFDSARDAPIIVLKGILESVMLFLTTLWHKVGRRSRRQRANVVYWR